MKKALAFLLAATVCLGLLAGCGKSASPYLPYSDTIRLDTPKDELIELEGLVIDENATSLHEERNFESEKDNNYYDKSEPVHIRYQDFSASYTFQNDKLSLFVADCTVLADLQASIYKDLVTYFSDIYGKGQENTENPAKSILNSYIETYWNFSIDTGKEYRLRVTSTEADLHGNKITIFISLVG